MGGGDRGKGGNPSRKLLSFVAAPASAGVERNVQEKKEGGEGM